jgi:hypothetical protein
MIAWIAYSVFIASLIAAAARATESAARLAGVGVRWIWACALALTVVLSGSAALGGATSAARRASESIAVDNGDVPGMQADATWLGTLSARVEDLRRWIDTPLELAVTAVHRVASPAADLYAAALSAFMTAALVLVVASVGHRFRVARRDWPAQSIDGIEVRVSPRIGPVVIGVVRPQIVVPQWLLARRVDEQRLVLTHELEHVRARDPLLLGLAWSAVIVAPWNPALWYMLSRLRLAVELDCDARVLRHGAAPQSYGALLIDVAQHASALRSSALALAGRASHLRQRILAMKPRVPRFAPARVGLAATFASAAVVAACHASLPNATELARRNPATPPPAREGPEPDSPRGDPATTAVPHARGQRDVPIPARRPTRGIDTPIRVQRIAAARSNDSTSRADSIAAGGVPLGTNQRSEDPIVYIDGVRSTMAEVKTLDPNTIEKIDVLKGRYAELFSKDDPGAVNGVILITSKPDRDSRK